MRKTILLMTATLMAAFIFAGTTEVSAQNKKVKELEEQIQKLRDSLTNISKQMEALEEENLRFRISLSLEESVADSTSQSANGLAPEEYTMEVTDSLLDIWYTHQMALQVEDEMYDMDSVKFASNVPDEVYIERLKKMNSFIQIPYNDIVRNYIIMYSEKMSKRMPYMLGLCKYYMPVFDEIFDHYGLPVEL